MDCSLNWIEKWGKRKNPEEEVFNFYATERSMTIGKYEMELENEIRILQSEPRYNSNGYIGDPDKTVKIFSPNATKP